MRPRMCLNRYRRGSVDGIVPIVVFAVGGGLSQLIPVQTLALVPLHVDAHRRRRHLTRGVAARQLRSRVAHWILARDDEAPLSVSLLLWLRQLFPLSMLLLLL